ncbi:MAG TPA: alpha/beta fold hydrolase [Chthoniobacteraceae bacterium]|jgi:pimeloyl-ACP methyl ester carboxylesterase|nr:alpha/beta fold hydrolase [Chthoniobacteraceae bacterium]
MSRGKKRLFGAGVGAGLLGAVVLALRYAVRPVSKARVPDAISPAIFRTKALHTSLGQIVYHESGSGPTLMFIHGICAGASSYEWSKVYPLFTATHRVLAPDLIGFGESARPDASLTAADYARSLGEFIRGTCDEPVTIVASGLGAGLSVLLASQHPEVVRQLFLWMPTGLTELGAARIPLSRRMASMTPLVHRFLYRNYESNRTAVRAWLAANGFADPARLTDETVEVYATCAQQYGAEHAVRNLCAGRLNVGLEERLPTLAQPVTFLWPEQPPSELPARLQRLAKGSRIVTGPPLSLLGAVEGAAEIAALLAEELDPGPKVVR